MTMRKYDKIRENIMIMQQMNAKHVEKPIEETPGPNFYDPSYNLIENNGYVVKNILRFKILNKINYFFKKNKIC